MKKTIPIIIAFAALCINVFAETSPLEVKISGKGAKSIIFIPGFACSGEVWNETVAQFENDHTCYVLTMPGFAGVPADADPEIKKWVELIADYIRRNNIDKPVVIGHSLGGVMAELLGAMHPEMIAKIVVVDALPCLPALSNPAFKTEEKPDCSLYLSNFSAMNEEQFYQMQKKGLATMVTDSAKIELVAKWSVKSDRTTLAKIYCQLMNTDIRSTISQIKCPSLILLEPNLKTMSSTIEAQYENQKNKKMVYGNTGLHFIMYDDKDWYLAQLKSFLQ